MSRVDDTLCDVMDWGSTNTTKGKSPEKAKQALYTDLLELLDNDSIVYFNDDREEDGHIFLSDLRTKLKEYFN
jgi:hypothetical protein